MQVTDLIEDLKDGTILVKLIENLTGKKIKGFHKAPETTAHMLDNLDLVFRTIQTSGIKLIGIGELYHH